MIQTKPIKIGIEIEGEFSQKASDFGRKFGEMKDDGSVNCCQNGHTNKQEDNNLQSMEFASSVIDLVEAGEKRLPTYFNAIKIFRGLNSFYKKGHFHYNESCGFHIHLSFNRPKFPPELFSIEFCNYFYKRLKKHFPEVWNLRKNNRFCRPNNTEHEIANHDTERYKGINLWAAREKHGTIEFRIFPSNEPLKMLKYLQFTLTTVKKFLAYGIEIKKEAEVDTDQQPTLINYDDEEVNIKGNVDESTLSFEERVNLYV